MADWPLMPSVSRMIQCGGGAAVVTGAANTKGSWTQLKATTEFEIGLLLFTPDYTDAGDDYLYDLGVGGAGSEQVIASNLIVSNVTNFNYLTFPFMLPRYIPAGSRLAARSQCYVGGRTGYLSIVYYSLDHYFGRFRHPITYGANTADSGGTQIDAGGSAYTEGAYAQLVAATTAPHHGLIIGVGNGRNTARVSGMFAIDIAIGGAGSEQPIIIEFQCGSGVGHPLRPFYSPFYPVHIPLGSRLSARCRSGITDATDRLIDVVVYCF